MFQGQPEGLFDKDTEDLNNARTNNPQLVIRPRYSSTESGCWCGIREEPDMSLKIKKTKLQVA